MKTGQQAINLTDEKLDEKVKMSINRSIFSRHCCLVWKRILKALDNPSDDKHLTAIALKKKEYNEIRKMSNDVRKKGSMSVQIVSNADEIVLQTLQYITSIATPICCFVHC